MTTPTKPPPLAALPMTQAATLATTMFESLAMALVSDQGDVSFLSAPYQRIADCKDPSYQGLRFWEALGNLVSPSQMERIRKALVAGKIWQGEISSKSSSNKVFWTYSILIPEGVSTTDKNPTKEQNATSWPRFTALSLDITTRKQIEEDLWVTVETLRAILTSTSFAVITTDRSGTILSFNPAAEDLLQWKSPEVIGKPYAALFHLSSEIQENTSTGEVHKPHTTENGGMGNGPQDQSFVSLAKRALSGQGEQREWTWKRKNGQEFPAQLSITPIPNKVGEITGVLIMGQDFTERKRMASELVASKEAAVAAMEARSQFFAKMSHELRTPLNGVLGLTTLMLLDEQDTQKTERLKVIQNSGQSLIRIINDLLDYSKLEANKTEFIVKPFSLKSLANEVISLLSTQASSKGLFLNLEFDPDIPTAFRGDETRIRQILTNLIGNALKFTTQGGVNVRILGKILTSDRFEILTSVKDTGIGIDKAGIERLFQAYGQANSQISARFGGTGLGLAISKTLCELMGGRMWVESTPGQGSTFFYTLPLPPAPESEVERPSDIAASLDMDLAKKIPLRILIADDNPTNQLVAATFLKRLGYSARIAQNGQEAVDLCTEVSFDLIFMDCKMPVMDGYEATKQILHNTKSSAKIPRIVALTASTEKTEIEQCYAAGMNDILAKPLELPALMRAIQASQTSAAAPVELPKRTLQEHAQLAPTPLPPPTPQPLQSTPVSENHGQARSAIWDPKKFQDNFSGMEDLMISTIGSFLSRYQGLLQTIEDDLQGKDAQKLELHAHALKGTLGLFFAQSCVALAAKLEKNAKDQNWSSAPEDFLGLKHQVKELTTQLDEFQKNISKAA